MGIPKIPGGILEHSIPTWYYQVISYYYIILLEIYNIKRTYSLLVPYAAWEWEHCTAAQYGGIASDRSATLYGRMIDVRSVPVSLTNPLLLATRRSDAARQGDAQARRRHQMCVSNILQYRIHCSARGDRGLFCPHLNCYRCS